MYKILAFLLFLAPFVSRADMLLPEVYVGVAYVADRVDFNYNINSMNDNIQLIFPKGAEISLGVRPIPNSVPILNNFRVEAQYDIEYSRTSNFTINNYPYSSAYSNSTQYGLGFYFDFFRFVPIVNPYLGYLIKKTSYDLVQSGPGVSDYSKTINTNIYYAVVGFNFKVPVFPLSVYLETRYGEGDTTDRYVSNIKTNEALVGVRWSFFGT